MTEELVSVKRIDNLSQYLPDIWTELLGLRVYSEKRGWGKIKKATIRRKLVPIFAIEFPPESGHILNINLDGLILGESGIQFDSDTITTIEEKALFEKKKNEAELQVRVLRAEENREQKRLFEAQKRKKIEERVLAAKEQKEKDRQRKERERVEKITDSVASSVEFERKQITENLEKRDGLDFDKTALSSIRGDCPFSAILFDLDDTLVATQSLECFRRVDVEKREVLKVLSRCEPLCLISQEFLLQLRMRWPSLKLSIVTRSPRCYADALLETLFPLVQWDSVVAYDDVSRQKPYPDSLLLALSSIDVTPDQKCLFVGDKPYDIEAAYAAGIRIAYFEAKNQQCLGIEEDERIPDWYVSSTSALIRMLSNPDKDLPYLEASGLPDENGERLTRSLTKYVQDRSPRTIEVLGRYWGKGFSGWRLQNEPMSSVRLKDYKMKWGIGLVERMSAYIKYQAKHAPLLVTIIPAKPQSAGRTHMETLLEKVEGLYMQSPLSEKVVFNPDVFCWTLDGVSAHKGLLNKAERFENVKNMELSKQWAFSGWSVLVIDDVVTTGATLIRAQDLVLASGADQCFATALAQYLRNDWS